jgi:26S proteasome regulatory subunit T5
MAEVWAAAEVSEGDNELAALSVEEINMKTRLLDSEVKYFKTELTRLQQEERKVNAKLADNKEKIKLNKQLPHLISNVVEILDVDPEGEEDGSATDLDSQRKGCCAVVKTSTRQVRPHCSQ